MFRKDPWGTTFLCSAKAGHPPPKITRPTLPCLHLLKPPVSSPSSKAIMLWKLRNSMHVRRGTLLLARVCRAGTMGHAQSVLIHEGRGASRADAFWAARLLG